MVIVHLNELVEVDAVEVEHQTQMVAPNEVVCEFDDALVILRIVLLEQKQKLRFDRRLIVVLLLILDDLDCDLLFRLVVQAANHITEGTLAYYLFNFVAVADLITALKSVVALIIVKTVVYESFQLCRLVLFILGRQEPNLLIFLDFCTLKCRQQLICSELLGLDAAHWVSEFRSFRLLFLLPIAAFIILTTAALRLSRRALLRKLLLALICRGFH